MSVRLEFVTLALAPGANVSELCRRFGISRNCGYKWIARQRAGLCLEDRSRRPRSSPGRVTDEVEARVLALREAHPAWGARKLKRRLKDLGHQGVPARSTVHQILVRHGRIEPAAGERSQPHQRFERAAPNQLWQMDYKGHFATDAGRCHPLTVLDDHSRYNLVLRACADERETTVKSALIDAMKRYGKPEAILADNGSPWGASSSGEPWTGLGVWLLREGITLLHGRPRHPQTQGKEERFHRTLLAEAIGTRTFADLAAAQRQFDAWRTVYNHQRPHDALKLDTPASRYQASRRKFAQARETVTYDASEIVRKVCAGGWISFHGQRHFIGKAFIGEPVALRPQADGTTSVYYAHHPLRRLEPPIRSDG